MDLNVDKATVTNSLLADETYQVYVIGAQNIPTTSLVIIPQNTFMSGNTSMYDAGNFRVSIIRDGIYFIQCYYTYTGAGGSGVQAFGVVQVYDSAGTQTDYKISYIVPHNTTHGHVCTLLSYCQSGGWTVPTYYHNDGGVIPVLTHFKVVRLSD